MDFSRRAVRILIHSENHIENIEEIKIADNAMTRLGKPVTHVPSGRLRADAE